MDTEKGQSRAEIQRGQVGPSQWWRCIGTHADWPGWTFAVTVNVNGRLVGFEMYGDGAAAGTDHIAGLRTQAGTLAPATDAPELTGRLLRIVPLRDLETAARRWVRRAQGLHASSVAKAMLAKLNVDRANGDKHLKWDEAKMAALCAEYVTLIDDEDDHAPVRTLHDRRGLSEKRIRNLLAKARGDLLTASPAGRAGGQLTDKAKEILSGNHQAS